MAEWWRLDGFPTAEEWQAVWALVTVGVAAAAAIVALRQHRAAVRDQLEQGRPFVVMDLAFKGTTHVLVVVSNTGRTGAHGVRLDWSTPPVAMDDAAQGAIDRTLVNGEIPFLAPGRSIRFMLNEYVDGSESDLPRQFEVKATYSSYDHRTWNSVSVLDVDQWAGASADQDPYEYITRDLKRIADAALYRRDADLNLARAADSINVYLEAGPRVKMARRAKREERERLRRAYAEASRLKQSSASESKDP